MSYVVPIYLPSRKRVNSPIEYWRSKTREHKKIINFATVNEHFVTASTIDQATAVSHNVPGAVISAGNLVIVRFGYQSDSITISSITDTPGNTWNVATSVHSSSGDTQTAAIAYSVITNALTGTDNISITLSATATLAAHLSWFDSDVGWFPQASVLDKVSGFNTSLGTNWTSNATAQTSQDDELLVGVAYSGGAINGGSSTATGGWQEEAETSLTHGFKLISQYQKVTTKGTYANTGTWSAAEIAACCIATFKTAVIPGIGASKSFKFPHPPLGGPA